MTVETPQQVADRMRRRCVRCKPENVIVAPDCGMKYLPREVAFGKMKAMVEGAKLCCADSECRLVKPPFRVEHVGSFVRPRGAARRGARAQGRHARRA